MKKEGCVTRPNISGEDAVVHFYAASQCAIQVLLEHQHMIAQHTLRGTAPCGRQHAPTALHLVGVKSD